MDKILFISGTRADYGKLKSLMFAVEAHPDFECHIFVTGMHTLNQYGYTAREIYKDKFSNIYTCVNQHSGDPMEMILATTIGGLSRYVHELAPDLIVTHGDRVEALAAAIVGALTNCRVAHIEGGERSGTIDESIRHSVSKLSHIHLVCNQEARQRLLQMGEQEHTIRIIGSPDFDVMASDTLPELAQVKDYYGIPFDDYAIVLFHPVTTETDRFSRYAQQFVAALQQSDENYLVIYPNNDAGNEVIFSAYQQLDAHRFKKFPSISFERFLVLMKHARFIIGNSSAGIREAPFYGVPSINVGSRQNNRYAGSSIINTSYAVDDIIRAIRRSVDLRHQTRDTFFGQGESSTLFMENLESGYFKSVPLQKKFVDLAAFME